MADRKSIQSEEHEMTEAGIKKASAWFSWCFGKNIPYAV